MKKRNRCLIIIATLLLISTVLAEITIITETSQGSTVLTTVDTTTATPISQTSVVTWTDTQGDTYQAAHTFNYKTIPAEPGEGVRLLTTLIGGIPAPPGTALLLSDGGVEVTRIGSGGPVGGGSPTVTTIAPTPTYYDNNDYSPPYSPPCACSSGQVDVSTTVCDSGCGLQVRTCDGCYWSSSTCDLNRRPTGLPTIETNCNDNIDNDCDNQADYDGGTIKNRGDVDCLVSLNPLTISASNPNENDNVEVTCTANAGNLRSMKASINSVDCSSSGSSGNNYRFNCNAGAVTQANPSKEVRCYVDTAKSYLSGSDRRSNINVCKLLSASWSNPNARQYEDVNLIALTTPGCNGKEVKFFVKNIGTGRNASFAPRRTNVVNGRTESSWTVEFESLNGQNPLYYFTAIID